MAARYRAVLARVWDTRPVSLKLAFGIRSLDDPASPQEALREAEAEARAADAMDAAGEPAVAAP